MRLLIYKDREFDLFFLPDLDLDLESDLDADRLLFVPLTFAFFVKRNTPTGPCIGAVLLVLAFVALFSFVGSPLNNLLKYPAGVI